MKEIKQSQITAITKAIENGKVKNKWAALNKIKSLQKKIRERDWENYLAK